VRTRLVPSDEEDARWLAYVYAEPSQAVPATPLSPNLVNRVKQAMVASKAGSGEV
jgi:hypothetical protein